jgi:hypothetical protein
MPESLQTFIWLFGIGVIGVLLTLVGFFVVRLINGMDSFKTEVTAALTELSRTMTAIRVDLGDDLADVRAKVKVIEEAGCIGHRTRRKEDTTCYPH